MEKEAIVKLHSSFEDFAYQQDDIEYWFARELQELLGYTDWRNFLNAVNKAKDSCETSGEAVSDHFVDVNKMVRIGSGAERKQDDIMLTRYACYLIAQNGDPKKEQIAFAQSYFAIQTRKQELLEERIQLMERLHIHCAVFQDPHVLCPRNPLIFGLFARMHLVEQVGPGAARMNQLMTDAGLPWQFSKLPVFSP